MNHHHILAASLIGKPWAAHAAGPDAFNCWGLVRHWQALAHGVALPDVPVGTADDQHAAIAAAVRSGGWLRTSEPPTDGDIAMLRNPSTGARHVGNVLRANGRLGLLHCEGSAEHPAPGVVWEPLADVLQRYHGLELWRRAC